jgi:hypothetical protein
MRFGQDGAHMIEKLDPEIRQHCQRKQRFLPAGVPQQRFPRDPPIRLVSEPVGMQRGDQAVLDAWRATPRAFARNRTGHP